MFCQERKEVCENVLLLEPEEEICSNRFSVTRGAIVVYHSLSTQTDGLTAAGAVFSAKVGAPAAVGMYRSTVRRNTVHAARCHLSAERPETRLAIRRDCTWPPRRRIPTPGSTVRFLSYGLWGGGVEVWRKPKCKRHAGDLLVLIRLDHQSVYFFHCNQTLPRSR